MQVVYKNFTRNLRYIMLYEEISLKIYYMDVTTFQTYQINMHHLGGTEYTFFNTVILQFTVLEMHKKFHYT